MRRPFLIVSVLILSLCALAACKPGLLPTAEVAKPNITLERVEVVASFPWADPPARVPLALAFVFNINNSTPSNILLDNMKFAFSFEVNPASYVELNVPVSYDRIYFPPGTTSQYRIVSILDSSVILGKLAVTQGSNLQALNLTPAAVLKNWYEKIGDFSFGIKVTEGMAVFQTDKGDVFVPFEGIFPKK
jgi:hypothetical protein